MRYRLFMLLTGLWIWHLGGRVLFLLHGFMAKHICSAIFVSGRSPEEIIRNEQKVRLFRLPNVRVEYGRRRVGVGLWGLFMRYAYYRPGRGCALCAYPPEVSWETPAKAPGLRPAHLDQPTNSGASKLFLKPWVETGPSQTLALFVMHRGKTLAEWYAPVISRHTPLPGWSMAKSVVNALVGVLVKQGKVNLHAPLSAAVWQGDMDRRQLISLHHLLQMSSGLPWAERYWWDSDVTRMLFDSEDTSQVMAAKAYDKSPGTRWQYASGTTNVISKVLRKLLSGDYHRFPYLALFDPLDMHTALMETDACGNFVGSSYMLASAADWAKFGQLYLQDGVWGEKRILPEGWVKYSTTPAVSAPQREYGAHFWLNLGLEGQPHTRKMPDVPADVYYASGFGGQRVFVVPSYEMVFVRLGAAYFKEPDFNQLLSAFLTRF